MSDDQPRPEIEADAPLDNAEPSSSPIVAVVGRPNVGKSTLFNRILGRRHAIVDDQPGITRDRLFSDADWAGHRFTLVDTGGIVPDSPLPMERLINYQVEQAIDAADVLVFLIDAQVSPGVDDERVAHMLRDTGRPVVLAANKADNDALVLESNRYWSLGLGEPHAISATHGRGIGDLLDRVTELLPADPRVGRDVPTGVPRVAIIGRPNVGKSSLVNALTGEETAIVSELPGTTRDAVDTLVEIDGRPYLFIDTAGLRRRSKVARGVEHFSTLRTIAAIQRAEVVLALVDSEAGVTAQDVRVAAMAADSGRGVVLVANKWDLVSTEPGFSKLFEEELRRKLRFLGYAALERISALTGRRVTKLNHAIDRVHAQFHRRIPTAELNRAVEVTTRRNPPPAVKGKQIRVLYAAQVGVAPQRFVYFVNSRIPLPESYHRFLNNRLRAEFGFEGVPLRLELRHRSNKKGPGMEEGTGARRK
ncbi:MAG: ribosome biogenesis GTPase Der [Gemmatimonadetes bacterium]|nr:ribosome biogenesis GTPase Der [Gemmatimonadota bacterium]